MLSSAEQIVNTAIIKPGVLRITDLDGQKNAHWECNNPVLGAIPLDTT